MPRDDFTEKTEPATPKKRGEARRKGQVPQSQEMGTAIFLLAITLSLAILAPRMLQDLAARLRAGVAAIESPTQPLFQDGGGHLARDLVESVFLLCLPLMAVAAFVGVAFSLLQTRFLFAPEKLRPDLGRLDPLRGLRRFFSLRSTIKLLISVAKLALLGTLVYSVLKERLQNSPSLMEGPPSRVVLSIGETLFELFLKVSLVLLALSVLDLLYQRWQYESDLKMTREEIKEEIKQAEGRPEVKRRIRQRQRELSRNRMIAEVEKATVVIVNPLHIAVALRYVEGEDVAPTLLAKGQGHIAARIREVAKARGTPIVRNPALARLIYRNVDIGAEIPDHLYVAVAEVLAYLYRLQRS